MDVKMSGILFLGNDDFQVRQGDQGLLLALTYESKGLTLVLFYSKECPYCDQLINKFKQLPNYVNGCQFAMVNVNRNITIVEKSKNTVAPITYVPDVILYVNGVPYVRYDGPHDINHIKEFIFNIYQKIQKTSFMEQQQHSVANQTIPHHQQPRQQQQQQQSQPQPPPPAHSLYTNDGQASGQIHHVQDNIPAYTIGKPTYGDWKKDGVCYLNFQNAYVNAT